MTQLNLLDDPKETAPTWAGTRDDALKRLQMFAPRTGRAYASSRNYDFGPENRSNISCLSPWIRHRLLLEEEVLRDTLSRHSLSTAEKFVQEVFWRAYFKGWLEHRPGVWTQYRADVSNLIDQLDSNSDEQNRYQNAVNGKTGIDCFDAWAAELVETGYLHNHTRMWFASIWIFTLGLPWQLGADFFLRHLLDGDPASNTLSWRWVAGLHTKGKHYIARKSNIEKYTDGKFSPGGLAIDPLPLFEVHEYPLQPIKPEQTASADKPYGLIITEEDCNPETLPLPGPPKGVLSLNTSRARSPLPVGKLANTFSQEALNDAVERSKSKFNCASEMIDPDEFSTSLVDRAAQFGVKELVTAYPPTGPVHETLEQARPVLENAGINLTYVRREYDSLCWPHATKGFFKLKAKIPKLLEDIGLR